MVRMRSNLAIDTRTPYLRAFARLLSAAHFYYKGFPTCQDIRSPVSTRNIRLFVKRSAASEAAKRRVRTARLQTVIDAAFRMLRTLMKDARGGLNR